MMHSAAGSVAPHLPEQAPIEAYGQGGFRFAGMSHRGSLLCLPSGIWAWPVTQPSDIDEASLSRVFAEADKIGVFLIGSGEGQWDITQSLRFRFRALSITPESMRTGHAINTYNILVGEKRRVAAALIAAR